MLTSRSAIEAYQDCPRYRYLTYHYGGRGVQSARPIRALEMGTALHKAMEYVVKHRNDPDGLYSVFNIIASHLLPTFKPFAVTDGDMWTVKKDIALIYGLVRAFMIVCKDLFERHTTIFTELDVSYRLIHDTDYPEGTFDNDQSGIIIESKADWVTRDTGNKEIVLWNYKSSKYSTREDGRIDKSYKDDLQGLLEVGILELVIKEEIRTLELILKQPLQMSDHITRVLEAIKTWKEILEGLKVSAVRYVFFIKGREEREWLKDRQYTGRVFNESPLVEGWRTQVGTDIKYAWCNKTVKPENKSGYGLLGKGWEKFYVHEATELGGNIRERMDKWIDMLAGDMMDSDLGAPLEKVIEIPEDKYRYSGDIEDALREVTEQEYEVYQKLITNPTGYDYATKRYLVNGVWGDIPPETELRQRFPMRRKRCTYPTECPMKTHGVCFKGRSVDELIQVGDLKWRTPHHRLELAEHVEKFGIGKEEENK